MKFTQANGYRLTDPSHLLDMILIILKVVYSRKYKASTCQLYSVGRLGEVLAIVVRFVSDWNIEQQLINESFFRKV